jgi:sulfur-oxidizing protein SoxB
MNLTKREFLQVLGAGTWLAWRWASMPTPMRQQPPMRLYEAPRFGNVSFLHMTDCHAQLKPIYFREPSVNLGIGGMKGQLPHLVGEHLLKTAKVRPGTARPMR